VATGSTNGSAAICCKFGADVDGTVVKRKLPQRTHSRWCDASSIFSSSTIRFLIENPKKEIQKICT
jgi:hypothetical protein